jgi:hypothetical protein
MGPFLPPSKEGVSDRVSRTVPGEQFVPAASIPCHYIGVRVCMRRLIGIFKNSVAVDDLPIHCRGGSALSVRPIPSFGADS